jgi:ABC-type nitrate/sulfonate/bicarbonate transport system substrate-binding protein
MVLKKVLEEAGLDPQRDGIEFVSVPNPPGNWARIGTDAIQQGIADGYWGNGMRAEYGVRKGIATVLLDIRRGDGPPAARYFTFPALITTERLVEEHPDVAAGAIRAIVKTQRALRADPSLATQAAQGIFPPEETEIIADLIARDADFYDPRITRESVERTVAFAQSVGFLTEPVAYEAIVATQFAPLWSE